MEVMYVNEELSEQFWYKSAETQGALLVIHKKKGPDKGPNKLQ